MEDMRGKFGKESFEETIGIGCVRYVGIILVSILFVIVFFFINSYGDFIKIWY